MDNVADKQRPSGQSQSPIFHKKIYYSISVSVLLALTLLQFHLISHGVDSYPSASAASKQDQDPRPQSQRTSPVRPQRRPSIAETLMERIDVDSYLKNQKALKLQLQCLVHDGPCDYIGRWLKPRIRMALLGECNHCSEKTRHQIAKVVDYIQSTYPEEFKAGVAKYLLSVGLEIKEENSKASAAASVLEPEFEIEAPSTTTLEEGSTDSIA